MLDLNSIRAEFAQRLAADSTRFSMDAALAYVVERAYQQGILDGQATHSNDERRSLLV